MAKKKKNRKSRKKVDKRLHNGGRNWLALAVHFATGAGSHEDGRTRRLRSRSAQKRAAINDYD